MAARRGRRRKATRQRQPDTKPTSRRLSRPQFGALKVGKNITNPARRTISSSRHQYEQRDERQSQPKNSSNLLRQASSIQARPGQGRLEAATHTNPDAASTKQSSTESDHIRVPQYVASNMESLISAPKIHDWHWLSDAGPDKVSLHDEKQTTSIGMISCRP